jgi:hypothetical protein
VTVDEWDTELSEEYEQEEAADRLRESLAAEREEALALELEGDEQRSREKPESPEKKQLKRELEQEALSRLESAARTVPEWNNVVAWWDRLDANRERRERYHEVSRSGDDLPIDYGAEEDGLRFPSSMNHVLYRQMQKGDFLDMIFDCPYEIHELVTEEYMSKALYDLSDDHKEILYFSAVRLYSSVKIAELRGQSDRNIRKVRNTMLKKIVKKILPYLKEREEKDLPMTMEERAFLAEMKEQS